MGGVQDDEYVNCTAISRACPIEQTIYGYYPSLPANAFFLAWFAILGFVQLFQGLKYKTGYFMIGTTLGCLTELIGYAGRIIMHHNPWSHAGFEIQICCLIIAPAFFCASIYITLKDIMLAFGPEYSPIKPIWVTYIFITCDLLALTLQGAGGGTSASADGDKPKQREGNNLMLSGIVWQVFTLLIFGLLSGWYAFRVSRSGNSALHRNDTPLKLFVFGVVVAYMAIMVRCIYRIPEISGGWRNSLMQDQGTFIAFDNAMVAVAALALTLFHPGFCFRQTVPATKDHVKEEKDLS